MDDDPRVWGWERVIEGRAGEHEVAVRDILGRGRIVEVDGERYLHEDVTRELGGFYVRVVPFALALARGRLVRRPLLAL
jgi:hypothetical protein